MRCCGIVKVLKIAIQGNERKGSSSRTPAQKFAIIFLWSSKRNI